MRYAVRTVVIMLKGSFEQGISKGFMLCSDDPALLLERHN
jgi:hypothetical protein